MPSQDKDNEEVLIKLRNKIRKLEKEILVLEKENKKLTRENNRLNDQIKRERMIWRR